MSEPLDPRLRALIERGMAAAPTDEELARWAQRTARDSAMGARAARPTVKRVASLDARVAVLERELRRVRA